MNTSRVEARGAAPGAPESEKSWIRKTPDVCGGDACVRETRITVWGLVEWKGLGLSDSQLLDQVEGLTPEDLLVAWKYASAHPEEIERAIRDNDEA